MRTNWRIFIALATVGVSLMLASTALAAPAIPAGLTSNVTLGYCGPPVTSKQMMIGYYMLNPTAKAHAEAYVRAHASYYHIQADQSFFAWLQMPNVKFFKAPAGYTLDGNTYCKNDGTVLAYNGHYSVGGLGMLWWCKDAKGAGSGCTPITKGYCRNFVHGKTVRPIPVLKPKPVAAPKPKPVPTPVVAPTPTPTTTTPPAPAPTPTQTQTQTTTNTNTNTNTNTVTVPVTVVVVVTPPPVVVVVTPPVVVTFTMSFDTINDIPAGTCRPEVLHVTSSVAGQVQISPNIGLISTVDCYRSNNERLSMVNLPVNTGSQDLTVYVYEPTDTSATSDTLTAVPLVTGVDAKNNTALTSFMVSHPTRL
jgi:hypothetical protein